jgi:hypothetical protein
MTRLEGARRYREVESFEPDADQLEIVDPDHFTAQIEQRTAAVAGVDLGGGLDEDPAADGTVGEADDAGGHGPVEAEGRAHREHGLTLPQGAGVGKGHRLEHPIPRVLDLEQREVRVGAGGNDANLFELHVFELSL